ELAGLPPTALAAARDAAARAGVEGYRLTLDAPSYIAVMTYADNRELRETMWRAQTRLAADEPWDNRPLIEEIIALRQEKARMLGYTHFADYVTEERMAGNADRVRRFLADLETRTRPAFEREVAELRAFAAERGCAELQPWDVAWYSEKLRRERYDVDEEALRPWFSLDGVLEGMFAIVDRVFGVRVEEVPQGSSGFPEVWHPDVRYFRVFDGDSEVGAFYADFFPRPDKRGGAWMNAFITGGPREDGGFDPHVGLLCANITPPAGDQPALLTHREVETVFHEFGHLLHHLLSRVPVHSLAGTNVPWDFVELPSQLMENWTWQKPALELFARHWQSGEPLPDDLLEPMLRARTFQAAMQMMRQLSFGTMDLWLHTEYRPGEDDVLAGCRAVQERFSITPLPDDYAMVCAFTHLFAGPVAYAAGYYSYKWAEVLDADVFSAFEQHGIFDRGFGRRYVDTILARGHSADPMELYVELLGREPDPDALLRRDGLLPTA
ncbi:MAG: M3 family peptidase, partial [Candidatus Dadabacteria bacterium]